MGRPPKDPKLRKRRNRATTARTVTVNTKPAKAPAAPALPQRDDGWHERTTAWWAALWDLFGELLLSVDYYPMLRLAELWDDYNRGVGVRVDLAREIRILESRWGLDEASRRSLQIKFEREAPAEKAASARSTAAKAPAVDPRKVLPFGAAK